MALGLELEPSVRLTVAVEACAHQHPIDVPAVGVDQGPVQAQAIAADLGYEGLPMFSQNAYTLYKGVGCADCTDGYKGRLGIYEIFEMNKNIEALLLKEATTAAIQTQAQRDGMLTMQQDGMMKALTGVTTIEEVSRVSAD